MIQKKLMLIDLAAIKKTSRYKSKPPRHCFDVVQRISTYTSSSCKGCPNKVTTSKNLPLKVQRRNSPKVGYVHVSCSNLLRNWLFSLKKKDLCDLVKAHSQRFILSYTTKTAIIFTVETLTGGTLVVFVVDCLKDLPFFDIVCMEDDLSSGQDQNDQTSSKYWTQRKVLIVGGVVVGVGVIVGGIWLYMEPASFYLVAHKVKVGGLSVWGFLKTINLAFGGSDDSSDDDNPIDSSDDDDNPLDSSKNSQEPSNDSTVSPNAAEVNDSTVSPNAAEVNDSTVSPNAAEVNDSTVSPNAAEVNDSTVSPKSADNSHSSTKPDSHKNEGVEETKNQDEEETKSEASFSSSSSVVDYSSVDPEVFRAAEERYRALGSDNVQAFVDADPLVRQARNDYVSGQSEYLQTFFHNGEVRTDRNPQVRVEVEQVLNEIHDHCAKCEARVRRDLFEDCLELEIASRGLEV